MMTPSEQRRYDTLLEIARKAQRVGNITYTFNMRAMPRQAIGGLSLEKSDIIVRQWHEAMQTMMDSLDGVDLDEMEAMRGGDDPIRQSLIARATGSQGRLRINFRPRR